MSRAAWIQSMRPIRAGCLATITALALGMGCGGGPPPPSMAPKSAVESDDRDAGAADAAGPATAEASPPRWTGPFCNGDGWCWENPLPQGNSLHGVWGHGPDDVFAVGGAGTVLHYDGTHWRAQPSSTNWDLLALWGSGSKDVFATGMGCTVLHYDGSRWRERADSPLRNVNQVNAFASLGAGQAVAVGYGGIFQYDGERWSQQARGTKSGPSMMLKDVWASGPDHAIAVGDATNVFHYDGRRWTPEPNPPDESFNAVAGRGTNDVYAAGREVMWHHDGRRWSRQTAAAPHEPDLWAQGDDLFAVSGQGRILRHDGTSWTRHGQHVETTGLAAIWGSDSSTMFAVGTAGSLLEYDGKRWTELSQGVRDSLHAVWGSGPEQVFAVGDSGALLRRQGARWIAQRSGSVQNLTAIWGSGPADVFAIGEAGTVLRFDGQRWSAQSSSTHKRLSALWGSSGSDVWAVGEGGTVLHYDGKRWSRRDSGTGKALHGVWGSGPADVFAIGEAGTVLHYDGKHWRAQSSGTKRMLRCLWGSGPRNVYVAGGWGDISAPAGALFRYDGTSWTPQREAPTTRISGLWGSGPRDVYAVGEPGLVYHFDGDRWTALASGSDSPLAGVWGPGPGEVYAVGADGAVLHRSGPASATHAPTIELDLASHCQGDPYRSRWISYHPNWDEPSSPEPLTCYLPVIEDWVALDMLDMRSCNQDAPTRLQQRMQKPGAFYVRARGALSGRSLRIRSRTELGEPCGGFCSMGWAGWRTLFADRVWNGRVITLKRETVLGDAKHRVELLLQVLDSSGEVVAQRRIDIAWPVTC